MANKYLNDTGLQYFYNKLKTVFQLQESGKGLSTNDYTTTEKNKLAGISAKAEVNQNAFSNVKVGDSTVAADTKTDTLTLVSGGHITIEADTTNDKITLTGEDGTTWNGVTLNKGEAMGAQLVDPVYVPIVSGTTATSANYYKATATPSSTAKYRIALYESGYLKSLTPADSDSSTKVATTAFVGTAITNALADITGISFEIVTALPTTGTAGTIYLLSNGASTGQNIYDEYVYVNSKWEKIGTTDVDLSGYLKKTDMVAITTAEIDTLFA